MPTLRERFSLRKRAHEAQVLPSLVPEGGQSVAPEKSPFRANKLVAKEQIPTPTFSAKAPIQPSQDAASLHHVRGQLREEGVQPQDLQTYLRQKVEEGAMPLREGIRILNLGKTEEDRQEILVELQAQEKATQRELEEIGATEDVKRLHELQREIPPTLIPVDYDHRRKELRDKNELEEVGLWKRLTTPVLHRVDVLTQENPDGTQTKYLDRTPMWYHGIIPLKAGLYKETYSAPDASGKRKLVERERVGDHFEVVGVKEPKKPGEKPQKVFAIATDETAALQKEARALQETIMRKNLGDLGKFVREGEWKGKGENPQQDKEAKRLRKQIKEEIGKRGLLRIQAKKQKQIPSPEKYTKLSFKEKVELFGRSIKELILPNNWKSARSIAISAGSLTATALILGPTPWQLKIPGFAYGTGRLIALTRQRTKLQQEAMGAFNPAFLETAKEFRQFQKENPHMPFLEQMREFKDLLFVENSKDKHQQLSAKKSHLSRKEVTEILQRRGRRLKAVFVGTTIALSVPAVLSLLGLAGVHLAVLGVALPTYGVIYEGLGALVHAPSQFLYAAGALAFQLSLYGYGAAMRIPDAITTARKKLELEKQARNNTNTS